MADGDVPHGVDLDSIGFVSLDLAGADGHHGHVSEETHQRSEAHAYSFGGAWFLPVLHVFAPGDELACRCREILASLSEPPLLRKLPPCLFKTISGFAVDFGGR